MKFNDSPTVTEAIGRAGLDWTVNLEDLFTGTGDIGAGPHYTDIKVDHKAVKRSDNGDILGVVGSRFTPTNNAAAFDLFTPSVEAADLEIIGAGSFKGGKHVWMEAKTIDAEAEITPNDPVSWSLFFGNGHDGSLSHTILFMVERFFCLNQLAAMRSNNDTIRIPHTVGAAGALEALRNIIDTKRHTFKMTVEAYRALAAAEVSELTLRRYLVETFNPKAEKRLTEKPDAGKRIIDRVMPHFDDAEHGTHGKTWWDAYNAITFYVTHERGKSADTRDDSNRFGSGRKLIRRAGELAMRYAAA